jgi:predicted nucleic acid-binding protein
MSPASASRARHVVATLILLYPALPDVDLDVPVRDLDNAPVVSAPVAGAAEAIVTGGRDLLEDDDLRAWLRERDIELLTPAELFDRLR